MAKKVAIIKHVRSEGAGTLSDYLQRNKIPYELVELYRGAHLPALKNLKALVVMGGPMNVDEDERYPFLTAEKRYLHQAIKEGFPVLGVCLGAQLIARAFKAAVTKNPHSEIGWFSVDLTADGQADPLFAGLPAKLPVVQWHNDTFAIPQRAKLLATSPLCQHQALRVHPFGYGVQFHVEVSGELLQSWSKASEVDFLKEYAQKKREISRVANQLYENFFALAQ